MSLADLLELPDLADTAPCQRADNESAQDPVKLEKKGVTQHVIPTELWSKQTIWKHSLVAKLREAGRDELASKLHECHTKRYILQCGGCKAANVVWNRCDNKDCPECQPRLARERKESVEWWTHQIEQPKHVVLTVRNTETITREHVKEIKAAFGRLRRMAFARNWKGGFYSLEITNESRGWHLHIHALIDCRFIPADVLSVSWNQATRGNGCIVKVKDCRDKSYLQEVTKYAVKGSDLSSWTKEDICAYLDAFDNVRTFGVFGSLYGKRTEWAEWIKTLQRDKRVCQCGCSDIKFYDWSEWQWKLLKEELSEQSSAVPKPNLDAFQFSLPGLLPSKSGPR